MAYEGTGVVYQSAYVANNPCSYAGGTTITNSRVACSNASAFGLGSVVVNNGSAFLTTAVTVPNAFTLSGNGWQEATGQLGALRFLNGAVASGSISLAGNTRVAASNNSSGVITGPISGAYQLEIGASNATGNLLIAGACSHTGDTLVNYGTMELTGSMKFYLGATGVSNRISGNATAVLNGTFVLDVSKAAIANGNSWNLVNTTTLNETFGSGFHIPEFTESSNLWTKVDGTSRWIFSETTGTLSVLTGYAAWVAGFPDLSDIAMHSDPNRDGENNLLEFATNQNPNRAMTATVSLVKNGEVLEFTYTRALAAMSEGVRFTVEWTDSLAAGSWSSIEATDQILSSNEQEQFVRVTIPVLGKSKRFVRLRVEK